MRGSSSELRHLLALLQVNRGHQRRIRALDGARDRGFDALPPMQSLSWVDRELVRAANRPRRVADAPVQDSRIALAREVEIADLNGRAALTDVDLGVSRHVGGGQDRQS